MGHEQDFSRAQDRVPLLIPESNQTEGTESDDLPEQVEQEEIRAVHQGNKSADEDEHGGVETRGGGIVRHVADGIEQDNRAEKCAHEGEQDAERVDVERKG